LVGLVSLEHEELDGQVRVGVDLAHLGDQLAAQRLSTTSGFP
jgi:hypothetical protein